jgi:hypothetical protein
VEYVISVLVVVWICVMSVQTWTTTQMLQRVDRHLPDDVDDPYSTLATAKKLIIVAVAKQREKKKRKC